MREVIRNHAMAWLQIIPNYDNSKFHLCDLCELCGLSITPADYYRINKPLRSQSYGGGYGVCKARLRRLEGVSFQIYRWSFGFHPILRKTIPDSSSVIFEYFVVSILGGVLSFSLKLLKPSRRLG